MTTLEFDTEDLDFLIEAMDKLTRSVSGDLAREKQPSEDTKYKLTSVIRLADRLRVARDGYAL